MSRFRFPGLRSFEEQDAALFNGRSKEKQVLFDLIMVERVAVLFAKSGAGKTSLLRAGIVPMLADLPYQPVLIRLNHREQPVLEQVFGQIAQVFGIVPQAGQTLWEYLHDLNVYTSHITPILFFDQFEELFTLYEHSPERARLIVQLSDLINKTMPADVRERLKRQNASADTGPVALEKPPRVKVVFAIRSDQLSLLHELSDRIPGILRNRYELKGLQQEQAAEAIVRPAALSGDNFDCAPFVVDPQALHDILDHLGTSTAGATNEVEAFQLQLVCGHLEASMLQQQQLGVSPLRVHAETYGGRAGLERLLANFYQDTIQQIADPTQQYNARYFIENELVRNERRISVAEAVATGRPYPVHPEVLHRLVNQRLLRREERPGLGNYYELVHDTLLRPVLQFKQERELRETAEKAQRERNVEARKRRRMVALAALFALLALGATAAFIYARQQQQYARQQQIKAQVNFLLAESKLQYDQDRTLAFRLAQTAWAAKPDHAEAWGSMIHAFYGSMIGLGDSLYSSPHYRDLENAAWAKPVGLGNQILVAHTNRKQLMTHDLATGRQATFELDRPISDAAISPDGRLLVTFGIGDSTAVLRAWGRKTALNELRHNGTVVSVAFSPDGQFFTTNSADSLQRLWSASGRLLAEYDNISTVDVVPQTAFSPEGDVLLVLRDDRQVDLHSVRRPAPSVRLAVREGVISRAVFSANGRFIALVSTDPSGQRPATVYLFDRSGRMLLRKSWSDASVLIHDLVPDTLGTSILVAASDSMLYRLQQQTQSAVPIGTCTERHLDAVLHVAVSGDEQLVASAAEDGTVHLWSQDKQLALLPHSDRIERLFFSADRKWLIAAVHGQRVRLWNIGQKPCTVLTTEDIPVYAFFRPGTAAMYARDFNSKWYAWDAAGRPTKTPNWLDEAVAFAAVWDARTLLLQKRSGELVLRAWDGEAATPIAHQPLADFTPVPTSESGLLALVRSDTVEVLDRQGITVALIRKEGASVNDLAWGDSGRTLTIAWSDQSLQRWSYPGQTSQTIELPSASLVLSIAPDGQQLWVGGQGRMFRWRKGSATVEPFLTGKHQRSLDIAAVAYTPDGAMIATASFDQNIMLWTGRGLWQHTFRAPEGFGTPLQLQFSDDGRYLLVRYDGNVLVRWDLKPDALRQQLDGWQARTFSEEEKAVYNIQ